MSNREWLRASPVRAEDLRNEQVRSRWDPWDSIDRIQKDGRNIRRKGGGLDQRQASKTLDGLNLGTLKRATSASTDVVYLIQRESGGAVKVGHTTMQGLQRRLKALQTAHSETLEVRGLFEGGAWLEAALHQLFADYRLRGEWFSVSSEMLEICPEVVDGSQKA